MKVSQHDRIALAAHEFASKVCLGHRPDPQRTLTEEVIDMIPSKGIDLDEAEQIVKRQFDAVLYGPKKLKVEIEKMFAKDDSPIRIKSTLI